MGQHKTRLVGWHPSDPAAVAWLDAEIARRGGGRGAQSAILDEALEKTMNGTTTTRLTDNDRWLITSARDLAAIPAGAPVADVLGQLGRAKDLLGQLADALERLGGSAP